MTNRWAVLVLLCAARISLGLNFQSVPALAPFLVEDLGIGYAEIGMLVGVFMAPGAVIALPGGLLGTRFGDKPVALTGFGLVTAGALLLAVAPSYALAVVARFVSGVGTVLLTVQLPKMTTDWFAGREISTAMAALMAMWPVGFAVALGTLGALAGVSSWRIAVLATAAYSGASLLAIAVGYRSLAARAAGAARTPMWTLSRGELLSMTWAGLAWMSMNSGFVVFMAFTPALLLERGRSVAEAGPLASWASLIAIGAMPLAGHLIDRTGRAGLFTVVGTAVTAAACVLLSVGGPPALWIAVFGIAFAGPAAALSALPSLALRPESRSTGFGVFHTIYYLGMSAAPPLAGALLDATGSAVAPIVFSAVLWTMLLPPLAMFRPRKMETVAR